MKGFIVINEEFTCQNCGHKNPPQKGSCRNHCQHCLYSLHLDQDFPGDRKSTCHSLMKPTSIHKSGKKGWIITHKCLQCRKEITNKSADDDNFDIIIDLSQQNEPPRV